jgi:DNA-directed RNA polymerase specialized sigma24 family protein
LGADHPGVGSSMSNLASLYSRQGKYPEAERLLKRALVILEKALGPNHREVVQTLNNLASLYKKQGKDEEATVWLLTAPQCLRLKVYAQKLLTGLSQESWSWGRGYRDLLREAATIVMSGHRAWGEGSDFHHDLLGAMRSVATTWEKEALDLRESVWEAAGLLSTAELVQLKKFARWRIMGLGRKARGRDAEDLIREALIATAEGRRVWNKEVNFATHLLGAVRSISTSWHEKAGGEYLESELIHAENAASPFDQPGTTADPERTFEAREKLEQVRELFAKDAVASRVIDLLGLGYTGKEIQVQLSISVQDFGAATKRIRRRLNLWVGSQGNRQDAT